MIKQIANFFKAKRKQDEMNREIDRLKASGESILLDEIHCEFRSNNYSEEIQDESRARSYDVLFNQTTTPNYRNITQSVIIFTNSQAEKFISQPFPINEQSLQASVMMGRVWLYIDPIDRKKYYFELK